MKSANMLYRVGSIVLLELRVEQILHTSIVWFKYSEPLIPCRTMVPSCWMNPFSRIEESCHPVVSRRAYSPVEKVGSDSLKPKLPGYLSPSNTMKSAAQLCQKTTSVFLSTTTPCCFSLPLHQSAMMCAGHNRGSDSLRDSAEKYCVVRFWGAIATVNTDWPCNHLSRGLKSCSSS